jgi:rod shape-determining protein MreC
MIFVDRGSVSGVRRGMAVVTPEGIVGKVIAAYPTASEVLLVTDPDFAAGVISLKGQIRGTLKGQGAPLCKIDYIHAEDKLQPGEWFYTSGDDRIFPRGFPVGVVKSAKPSQPFQEVYLEPSGLGRGLEDVLILIDAVHQELPENPPENQSVYIAPPLAKPSDATGATPDASAPPLAGPGTQADQIRNEYESAAQAQGHTFGEGGVRTKGPDFTKLGQQPAAAPPPKTGAPGTTAQPANAQPRPAQPAVTQPSAAPAGGPKSPQPAAKAPQTATPPAGQTAAPKQQPAARPPQNQPGAAPGATPGTATGIPARTQPATTPNGSTPAARQASPAAGNPRPAPSTPGASPVQ